ncbi:DUF6485 family protein [Dehalococcoidia bacterium]|nr:DUF6485 family protein [Dehalococcoidia bacterium]
MECAISANKDNCSCAYEPCNRKGECCECLSYHWSNRELPACLFPADVERNYNRSLRRFIEVYSKP